METVLDQTPAEKVPDLLRLPSAASPHETALPGTKECVREQRVCGEGRGGE